MLNQRARALWSVAAVVLIFGLILLAGCSDSDEEFNKPGGLTGSCESCHQDQDLLTATADPVEDDGGEGAGEG